MNVLAFQSGFSSRWAETTLLVGILLVQACESPSACGPDAASPALPKSPQQSPSSEDQRIGGQRIARQALLSVQKHQPILNDVARELGIDFTYFNDAAADRLLMPETTGGGSGWFDYDLDGYFDLYLLNGCDLAFADPNQTIHRNQLYRNNSGLGFINVTTESQSGDNGFGQGCSIADYDADGFPDIYVANYGANVLYRNNGDGTFSDVTESAQVGDRSWGTSCVWIDVDADGLLDLYLANYADVNLRNNLECKSLDGGFRIYCAPTNFPATADCLYVSQGDGTFPERLNEYGMRGENGRGLSVIAVDLDNDLRPELYVANDATANFLFTRSDNPHVRPSGDKSHLYCEVAGSSGCAVSGEGMPEASMGISCADFNSDGRPDLYVTNFIKEENVLYQNMGKLLFRDERHHTGVAAISRNLLGFGTIPFDYDGDGSVDIFVANGHVFGPHYPLNEMPPQLLRNDGRGRFVDISDQAGDYFHQKYLGRGVSASDYDNDGDLDLTVTHLHRPLALLRNDTDVGLDWVGLDLKSSNRIPPVGGRIVFRQGERKVVRPIVAGGSYLSSADPRHLFWVGAGEFQIEVHWPSGTVERLEGLERNRYHRIPEGKSSTETDRAKAPAE